MVLAVECLFPFIELFEAFETEYALGADWIRQQTAGSSLQTVEALPVRWKIPSAYSLDARFVFHRAIIAALA